MLSLSSACICARTRALLLLLAVLVPAGEIFSTDYYVSASGNDAATGTSIASAWRSIAKANAASLRPGDRLLFEGGQTFAGKLVFRDVYGLAGNIITVSSYGSGKATLSNPGGGCIEVSSCSYLEFSHLIVAGGGWNTLNNSKGLALTWLSDSLIDDVEARGFHKAGIYINRGIRVRVTNAHAHDNGFAGIHTEGGSSNLYIGYSRAIHNPGDLTITDNHSGNGILVSFTTNSLVEYCEAADNGALMPCTTMGPFGIWTAEVDSITIQHCISHDNKSPAGAWDGGGFDLDGNTNNSILQYNYSYNNYGAGYLLCTWPGSTATGNTIRYNVSENDGYGCHKAGIYSVGSVRQANHRIYNNTIYNSAGRNGIAGDSAAPASYAVRNNIIVMRGSGAFVDGMGAAMFQGNTYWNFDHAGKWESYATLAAWRAASGKETLNGADVGMHQDPLLANAGFGERLTDPTLLGTLSAYKLSTGSPCIDRGLDLGTLFGTTVGAADLYGSSIPFNGSYDRGAHEKLIPPTITSQPAHLSVTTGQTATFSVAATGAGTLAYQWQRLAGATWSDLGGATASSYTFTPASTDSGAQFRVVVSNSGGASTSTAATLTVGVADTAPLIITQPANQKATVGEPVTFSLAATGIPVPTVQWQSSADGSTWSNDAAGTTSTYTFIASGPDSTTRFRAVVQNRMGTVMSQEAVLTVAASTDSGSTGPSPGTDGGSGGGGCGLGGGMALLLSAMLLGSTGRLRVGRWSAQDSD